MKIAICSDFHLGFKWDSERREDSFENAKEAVDKSLDSDLILMPGDLFDTRVPRQEVLSKAADVFLKPVSRSSDEVKLKKSNIEDGVSDLSLRGTPVVAIHGTHERRSKGFVNTIQLLEQMGYLVHLHGDYVVFENDQEEKVAIHGLSGVPERYARDALDKMDPDPVEDAYNILMLHQSIGGYVYSSDGDSVLKVEDLPQGFDLIIDGHIHWCNYDDRGKNKNLIFPGSTITTQMRKVEAEKEKGILFLETESDELEFEELESPRNVFYLEVDTTDLNSQEARQKIKRELESLLEEEFDKKPLIRLSIKGDQTLRISKSQISQNYSDRAILSIKKEFKDDSERKNAFEEFEQEQKSVEKIGKDLLAEKVSEIEQVKDKDSFRSEDLFSLLVEGQNEEAMKILEEKIEENSEQEKKDSKKKDDEEDTADQGQENAPEGNLNKFIN